MRLDRVAHQIYSLKTDQNQAMTSGEQVCGSQTEETTHRGTTMLNAPAIVYGIKYVGLDTWLLRYRLNSKPKDT